MQDLFSLDNSTKNVIRVRILSSKQWHATNLSRSILYQQTLEIKAANIIRILNTSTNAEKGGNEPHYLYSAILILDLH